jgi:hypothetical protein
LVSKLSREDRTIGLKTPSGAVAGGVILPSSGPGTQFYLRPTVIRGVPGHTNEIGYCEGSPDNRPGRRRRQTVGRLVWINIVFSINLTALFIGISGYFLSHGSPVTYLSNLKADGSTIIIWKSEPIDLQLFPVVHEPLSLWISRFLYLKSASGII